MNARNKFFLGHISISLISALLVLMMVFFIWYPFPLNKAVGVTHIFFMMLAIDVIIGPMLGWFVYKEGKKTLKFDISVIILIQIFALGYGLYNIAQARPAWLVFNVDRFELIKNNEVVYSKQKPIPAAYRMSPLFGPKFVEVKRIVDRKDRSNYMMEEIFNGISLAQRAELYQPIVQNTVKSKILPIHMLNKFNERSEVNNVLQKYPKAIGWLPLQTRVIDMIVLMDKQGAVIRIVDLRPWN